VYGGQLCTNSIFDNFKKLFFLTFQNDYNVLLYWYRPNWYRPIKIGENYENY